MTVKESQRSVFINKRTLLIHYPYLLEKLFVIRLKTDLRNQFILGIWFIVLSYFIYTKKGCSFVFSTNSVVKFQSGRKLLKGLFTTY